MEPGQGSLKQRVQVHDLGLISYQAAWQKQTELQQGLIALKRQNRDLPDNMHKPVIHHLVWCEHPAVYTLGKSGSKDHLLISEAEALALGIDFHEINRGGDITFHGPGQVVCYPIFDLDLFFTDVHKYVRYLEEAVIRSLSSYGLAAKRVPDYTGVWLGGEAELRKICAIGVHLSRWVTLHGFALNINTDLSYFDHIVPCGIQQEGTSVTSLAAELQGSVELSEVQAKLLQHLADLFDFEVV